MKRPLEVWQAVVATFMMLIVFITIIVQQSNKIQYQGDTILFLQQSNMDTKTQFMEVNANLKELSSKLTEIQVAIVNKQDRK